MYGFFVWLFRLALSGVDGRLALSGGVSIRSKSALVFDLVLLPQEAGSHESSSSVLVLFTSPLASCTRERPWSDTFVMAEPASCTAGRLWPSTWSDSSAINSA